MQTAPRELTRLGMAFLTAADEFAGVVVSDDAWAADPETWIPRQSFRLSLSNMLVIQAGLEGTLSKALMPFAARVLLEDGARWAALLPDATQAGPGETLKALVKNATWRRDRIAERLSSEGVPQHLIDDVLGAALAIPQPEPPAQPPPSLDQMLQSAYANASGVDSARAMYAVLSQFVHATPISNWHIRRDTFPSLTALIYAVSIEAAARGFERIASITAVLVGVNSAALEASLNELRARRTAILQGAFIYHALG